MFKIGFFFALFAAVYGSGVVPYASPVGATLLPKVNVAPSKLTVVKQPYVVTQTEAVYRSVPVPVRAVAYTAPKVVAPAPVAYAAPAPVAYAAPAVAPAPVAYAAPAVAPAPLAYTAPAPVW